MRMDLGPYARPPLPRYVPHHGLLPRLPHLVGSGDPSIAQDSAPPSALPPRSQPPSPASTGAPPPLGAAEGRRLLPPHERPLSFFFRGSQRRNEGAFRREVRPLALLRSPCAPLRPPHAAVPPIALQDSEAVSCALSPPISLVHGMAVARPPHTNTRPDTHGCVRCAGPAASRYCGLSRGTSPPTQQMWSSQSTTTATASGMDRIRLCVMITFGSASARWVRLVWLM